MVQAKTDPHLPKKKEKEKNKETERVAPYILPHSNTMDEEKKKDPRAAATLVGEQSSKKKSCRWEPCR